LVAELPDMPERVLVVPLAMGVQRATPGVEHEMVNPAVTEAPATTVTLRGFSPCTAQLAAKPVSATV
jgi:hypothetical protein